jgi:hypothetical protein
MEVEEIFLQVYTEHVCLGKVPHVSKRSGVSFPQDISCAVEIPQI